MSLRQAAFLCLSITDPVAKYQRLQDVYASWKNDQLLIDPCEYLSPDEALIPGRPAKPLLVDPLSVKKRAMHTQEGRAVVIHALTHIEFNAINLALDALWRFSEMPHAYYTDWLQVAYEEARHFMLLKGHLQSLGFDYGDFPAHNSLWEMVDKTKGDSLARMALVPRTMEARGLDAVPVIRERFLQVKDHAMVKILDTILEDEIGHVAIGNHWFNYLCTLKDVDPVLIFSQLCLTYRAPMLRPPFNINARERAGFTQVELALLHHEE